MVEVVVGFLRRNLDHCVIIAGYSDLRKTSDISIVLSLAHRCLGGFKRPSMVLGNRSSCSKVVQQRCADHTDGRTTMKLTLGDKPGQEDEPGNGITLIEIDGTPGSNHNIPPKDKFSGNAGNFQPQEQPPNHVGGHETPNSNGNPQDTQDNSAGGDTSPNPVAPQPDDGGASNGNETGESGPNGNQGGEKGGPTNPNGTDSTPDNTQASQEGGDHQSVGGGCGKEAAIDSVDSICLAKEFTGSTSGSS